MSSRAATLSVVLALAGCAAGPDFVAPAPPATQRYAATEPDHIAGGAGQPVQDVARDAAVDPRWWTAFGSPALDAQVARALAANASLDAARATLAQAAYTLQAARGAALPRVTLGASVQRSGGGRTGEGTVLTVGPSLDHTPDVFGGIRRRIEQARALRDYQQAQWQAARLAVAGNTVLQAIALASAQAQLAAVQDIVAVDRRTLALVEIAAEAGRSARLDVLAARSQLAADLALLPPLVQQAGSARHALAVLAGDTTAQAQVPAFTLDTLALPGRLPLTLPSRWVRQRPDIVAAQAQLQAANAAVGVATAALYPQVTLSASWTAVDAVGAGGRETLWMLAAGLLAPLLDGHVLASQRAAAVEAYAAQLGTYRQTVLAAFGQVADALQALEDDAALQQAQQEALETAAATLALTQEGYEAGRGSLLQLLDAQRQYQRARLGEARARAQRHADSAQWFIAMGGAPPGDAGP